MTLQTDLEAAVAKVAADSNTLHSIVHGPALGTGSTVTTEGGSVKSAAKAVADAEAYIVAQVGSIDQAVTDAQAAQTAAAGSAAAAAATLASALWRDVVFVTSANSPLAITQASNGKLYVVDSTSGAVVITLPQISAVTMPFTLGIKHEAGGNSVTISRSDTATIDGATSKILSVGMGCQLLADADPVPDVWTAIDFGLVTDTDEKVKVSANDTAPGYMNGKLVAGTNIVLSEANDGGNETLVISCSVTSADQTARDQIALTNLRLMLASSVASGALIQGYQWELATDEWGASSTSQTYNSGSPSYYGNSTSTSYSNAGATGARTYLIVASGNGFNYAASASVLINGSVSADASNSLMFDGQTLTGSQYLQWDFGSAVLIDEFRLVAQGTSGTAFGNWKIQGSANGSTWTDLKSTFALVGGTSTYPFSNVTGYRYYRLQSVSGTCAGSWWEEMEFKIAGLWFNGAVANTYMNVARTVIDRDLSLTNGATVNAITLYNVQAAGTGAIKIVLENSATSHTVVYTQSVSYTGGGTQTFALTTPYTIPATGTYRVAFYQPASNFSLTTAAAAMSYFAGDMTGTQTTTVNNTYTYFFGVGYQAGTNNMTLLPPASVSVASAPSYMDAYFLWKDDSGTAVLGTDLTVELSRDGGSTWTAASLISMASYDGTYSIIKARASVSAQPSGTSLKARIKTLNTKAQRVAAPAIYAE